MANMFERFRGGKNQEQPEGPQEVSKESMPSEVQSEVDSHLESTREWCERNGMEINGVKYTKETMPDGAEMYHIGGYAESKPPITQADPEHRFSDVSFKVMFKEGAIVKSQKRGSLEFDEVLGDSSTEFESHQ